MTNALPATMPVQELAVATPMHLLSIAMNQGADLEKLQKLMELQERWEANEARKAFNVAFAAFKAEAVTIVKNVTIGDGPLKGKKYADLFAVVDAITPALSTHGLSAAWRITRDDKDWIEVTCILRHTLGHSESVSMGAPPDSGGAKSVIQGRGSTVAYLERYTMLAIAGLSSKNQDDDGKGKDDMDDEAFHRVITSIQEAKTMDELQAVFTAAYKAAKHDGTKKAISATKDKRKAELQGGPK